MNYDIIIKNGKIIDGAGNPWYYGEIGIKDGIIKKIHPELSVDVDAETKMLDAKDLIICPGFIDMHSHTDIMLPIYSRMDTAVRQGITTQVVGMCGDGLAPVPKDKLAEFKEIFKELAPMGGEVKIPWDTYSSYLEKMGKLKIPCNLAFCVGFGTIRVAGGSGFENRPPTIEELNKMKAYVAEAMEAGAFGMSTGLIYAPQVFANTEEIIELVKVVANYNGLYFSHIRGEGRTLIKAVKEFIEIVEKSGCSGGQIAHHKAAGKEYWGNSKISLQIIEEANARGINITYDQYPYDRGHSGLVTTLPPWVREGGKEKILERLKSPEERERIKKDILEGSEEWASWIKTTGFENIFISFAKDKKWKDIEGYNISEITKMKGKYDDWETYYELLTDNEADIPITIKGWGEEDICRIMKGRYQMFGTDASAFKHLPGLKNSHPRTYGTYPKVLGKYVREEKVLTLEDAIRRMTSFPAQKLRLRDRGLIKEGNWADITIFNPLTVHDKATYMEPHQLPDGIIHVIINGEIVVENEKQRRKYPGKIIKRPS